MKLTHHDNGTFTLSGLTGSDLSTLSNGLGALAAMDAQASEGRSYNSHNSSPAARVWAGRRWRYVEKMGNWLRDANQYGGRGLRRRSSTSFDEAEPTWPSDAEVSAA